MAFDAGRREGKGGKSILLSLCSIPTYGLGGMQNMTVGLVNKYLIQPIA